MNYILFGHVETLAIIVSGFGFATVLEIHLLFITEAIFLKKKS